MTEVVSADISGNTMLLGHIALGIYTLSLTAGLFVLNGTANKVRLFHRVSTVILMVIEAAGIGCVLYYFITHGIV